MPNYKRLNSDMQKILVDLNLADDFHKAKSQIESLEQEIEEKDRMEYDLKHDLISALRLSWRMLKKRSKHLSRRLMNCKSRSSSWKQKDINNNNGKRISEIIMGCCICIGLLLCSTPVLNKADLNFREDT